MPRWRRTVTTWLAICRRCATLNGVTNLYQYDSRNRLTNAVWQAGATSLGRFAYAVGPAGNRTSLAETIGGLGTLGCGFDAVGNRLSRASSVSGISPGAASYTANDWLAGDGYDANGNTTNSGAANYQYDALGRLTNATVNGVQILPTYDGDGNRASKTVGTGTTTYYLVDDRNPSGYAQVVEEYQGMSLSRVYNYGLALISQRTVTSGAVSYFGTDGHGSTRFLTDAGGNLTDTYTYDAYGILISSGSSGSTPNSYLYCGQQWDSDLGMYYLRARYYKPDTGRFWTMDTYDGNNEDPLSLHKYLYCQGNPIMGFDPSGHDDVNLVSVTAASGIGTTLDTMGAAAMAGLRGAGAYVARRVGNAFIMGTAGAVAGGIDSKLGGGSFADGLLPGFEFGSLFGLVPPQAWATSGGGLVLKGLAAIGICNAIDSFEDGNIKQGFFRAVTSALPMEAIPATPKKLYVYFSSDKLQSIKTEGLRLGTSNKVWASTMSPDEFSAFRLGGNTGINFIRNFPFFSTFAKKFDCVAEISDVSDFQTAALTYKQLLGQFESSCPIPPGKLKISANGNGGK